MGVGPSEGRCLPMAAAQPGALHGLASWADGMGARFQCFLLVYGPFAIVWMLMFGIAATRRALAGITIVSTAYMLV